MCILAKKIPVRLLECCFALLVAIAFTSVAGATVQLIAWNVEPTGDASTSGQRPTEQGLQGVRPTAPTTDNTSTSANSASGSSSSRGGGGGGGGGGSNGGATPSLDDLPSASGVTGPESSAAHPGGLPGGLADVFQDVGNSFPSAPLELTFTPLSKTVDSSTAPVGSATAAPEPSTLLTVGIPLLLALAASRRRF